MKAEDKVWWVEAGKYKKGVITSICDDYAWVCLTSVTGADLAAGCNLSYTVPLSLLNLGKCPKKK